MKKVLLTVITILTVIMGTLAFVSCNVNVVRPDSDDKTASTETGASAGQSDKDDSDSKGSFITSIIVNDKGEIIAVYNGGTTAFLGTVGSVKSGEMKDGKFVLVFIDGKTITCDVVATANTVVSIKTVGNIVEIEYDDGHIDKIELGGNVTCRHENASYNEQVPHSMNDDGTFENGIYLELCPDCGYTKTIEAVIHSFKDLHTAPTCMSDGYTSKKCTVCGYETNKEKTVDALGHDFVVAPAPSLSMEENKKWCEEGGLSIEVCSRCNALGEYVTVSPENARGHHSDKWTIEIAPTWNRAGTLVGVCKVCKNSVEKVIPSCSDDAYTISNIRPEVASCGAEKTGTCTITIDEQTIVINDVTIPGEMHTFKGEKINDEEVMIFKNRAEFDARGFNLMGNNSKDISCAYVSDGYFICDKCGKVIKIMVKQSHAAGDESGVRIILRATCEKSGEKEIDCITCGETVTESIPAVGHYYTYEVNDEDGVIVGTCQNVADGKVITCEHPYDIYDNLKKIEIEVVNEATCQSAGLTRYTLYRKDGKIIIQDVVEKKLDHLLLRADKTTVRISDGDDERILLSAYPEIKPFGNAIKSCSAPFGGSFVCEDCGEVIAVNLYIPHTLKEGTYKYSNVTCVKDGTGSYYCTACEQNIVDEVFEKALGHEYNWTIVDKANSDDGKYHLIGECCREFENEQGVYELCRDDGYKLDYISAKPITCETLIRSTCQKQGKTLYMITKSNGTTEKIIVNDARLSHLLNGNDINYYKPIPVTTDGVKLFGNSGSKLTCDGGAVGGYFVCETCNEVINIMVIKPHTQPVKIAEGNEQKPTCTKEGWVKYDCIVCKTTGIVETVEPLGHDYKRTIIDKADSKDGKYHLVCVCQRKRTNKNGVLALCTEDGNEVEYVSDEPITEKTVKATCSNNGKRIYTLAINGKTQTIVDIIPRSGIHDFNGMKIDENKVLVFADSTAFDATGLKLMGNTSALSCAGTSQAYFVCENDGWLIAINVRLAHTPDESDNGVCSVCGQSIG